MGTKRDKIIALLLTLLIGIATTTSLLLIHISPAVTELPHAEDAEEQEIFFADIEYTEITVDPTPQVDGEPASAAASEQGGLDDIDSGSGESLPELVADETPQPEEQQVAKAETPEPPAPTKEEIEAEKRAAIQKKIGQTTGLKAADDGQAAGTATSGNASTGTNTTSDGLGLDGRKRTNKPDPGIKNAQGKVWVKITVNAEGTVTSAVFVKSSGFGEREAEVREACVNASRQLKYTPDSSKPTQQGTITWNIK